MIGYALGKFRGANREAEKLTYRLMYWGLLQKLDQLTEPLAVRSAMGKLPSNDDVRRLANVMTSIDEIKQGSMWDTDMTDQGARMWGELSHDEAHAIRRVQSFAHFLFSVAYPCAPTEVAFDVNPNPSFF